MNINDFLFENQDKKYADFTANLVPNIPREKFIGVRVPTLRKLAKKLKNTPDAEAFLKNLPHQYHDENMLHAILISETKDYEKSLGQIDAFLPFVDNWEVCDALIPLSLKQNRENLLPKIKDWISSDHTYTCRFGIKMLMTHFLDERFSEDLLSLPGTIKTDEYYINMMIAWFFQVALVKQWDAAIKWLEKNMLPADVQNKTIQKCQDSYRISPSQKSYLKKLKQ